MAGICNSKIILQQNFLFWNIVLTEFLKKEILMADISTPKIILEQNFPFLVSLVTYISRSCDACGSVDVDIDIGLT